MDISEFSECVSQLVFYPRSSQAEIFGYLGTALAGEVGELCNLLKKHIRDFNGKPFSQEEISKIELEIGDCLWYITAIANELGIDLNDVLRKNIDKLNARYVRK